MPDFQQIAEKLAAEVPGAKHVQVPDAAHLVSLEKPALFDRLVWEFIGKNGG